MLAQYMLLSCMCVCVFFCIRMAKLRMTHTVPLNNPDTSFYAQNLGEIGTGSPLTVATSEG